MSDAELGAILAGLTVGLLVGILLTKLVESYRKKRGWDE